MLFRNNVEKDITLLRLVSGVTHAWRIKKKSVAEREAEEKKSVLKHDKTDVPPYAAL
jgi:hypothetical protein